MQTRLSEVSNTIFKYFVIFAIIFMWLNFYSRNIMPVFLASIIFTIIVGKIIAIFEVKKKNRIKLSQLDNKKMQDITLQLLFNSNKENLQFFHILLKTSNSNINTEKCQIETENYIFVPLFISNEITEKDVLNVYKLNRKNTKKIIISCINFSQNAKLITEKIQSHQIHLFDINQTFALMKKYDFYPELRISSTPPKKFDFKTLKKIFFAKQNARHYLFSGIIILITSFFIRYSIYYIIFATLLFIFAGISRFNTRITKSNFIDEL